MKLVLATKNKNKIKEIEDKFSSIAELELISLNNFDDIPEIEETGSTFEENALLKARAIAQITGLPAMADDSGLIVDALDGRPGVYSARYGGADLTDGDRNALLLNEMTGIEAARRTARFICVMAVVFPEGKSLTAEGTCEGTISLTPSGNHGFGYDPIFYLPQYQKTMAQLSLDKKNQISHRAIALGKIKNLLVKIHDCI